jgi:hypothetical protein
MLDAAQPSAHTAETFGLYRVKLDASDFLDWLPNWEPTKEVRGLGFVPYRPKVSAV